MQFLKDFLNIFYPNICTTCTRKLLQSEVVLCSFCRHDLPFINDTDFKNNKVYQTFYGRVPIEKAMSFLFYRKTGKVRTLIHQLKYNNREDIGVFLGNWFGNILRESQKFSTIDYIIPVPLHPKRLKERGYNQLTKFGKQISVILKTEYLPELLVRVYSSKTQTLKQRFDRFTNTQTHFLLTNKTILERKHILLIDDVITTGATLEACCIELLKTKDVKISIATMAFTE